MRSTVRTVGQLPVGVETTPLTRAAVASRMVRASSGDVERTVRIHLARLRTCLRMADLDELATTSCVPRLSRTQFRRAWRCRSEALKHVLSELAAPPVAVQNGYELLADVHLRCWPGRIRVPVVVEVESARQRGHGMIARLRWHAQWRQRAFPVMEADLIAHPLAGGNCELMLAGTYRPPLGFLGLVGHLAICRVVARSTAEAFIDELSRVLEAAVAQRRCPAPTMAEVA